LMTKKSACVCVFLRPYSQHFANVAKENPE
jgi:hypothetical protein